MLDGDLAPQKREKKNQPLKIEMGNVMTAQVCVAFMDGVAASVD